MTPLAGMGFPVGGGSTTDGYLPASSTPSASTVYQSALENLTSVRVGSKVCDHFGAVRRGLEAVADRTGDGIPLERDVGGGLGLLAQDDHPVPQIADAISSISSIVKRSTQNEQNVQR